MTEFGRRVYENGSLGTDHGRGFAVLALGHGINGGKVHGKWPGLSDAHRFEGRDLAVTTDFRDVFSEVVAAHMGASHDSLPRIFPGYRAVSMPGVIRA